MGVISSQSGKLFQNIFYLVYPQHVIKIKHKLSPCKCYFKARIIISNYVLITGCIIVLSAASTIQEYLFSPYHCIVTQTRLLFWAAAGFDFEYIQLFPIGLQEQEWWLICEWQSIFLQYRKNLFFLGLVRLIGLTVNWISTGKQWFNRTAQSSCFSGRGDCITVVETWEKGSS